MTAFKPTVDMDAFVRERRENDELVGEVGRNEDFEVLILGCDAAQASPMRRFDSASAPLRASRKRRAGSSEFCSGRAKTVFWSSATAFASQTSRADFGAWFFFPFVRPRSRGAA
jgi:hypothetical protein